MSNSRQPCHVSKLIIVLTKVTRQHRRYTKPLPNLIPKRTKNIAIQKQMICCFLISTTRSTNHIFWLNHTPMHQVVFSRQTILKEAPRKQRHLSGDLLVSNIYNKTSIQMFACGSNKSVSAPYSIAASSVQ